MHRLIFLCSLFFTLPIATTFIQVQSASAHAVQTSCRNIAPAPDYLKSGKPRDAIAAINHARHQEHIHSLRLPSNFYRLSPIQQQLKLVNSERVDRGLRPLLASAILSQMAQGYAQQMEIQHFFSHTSPAGVTFLQRINNNPAVRNHYSIAAENIAANPIAGVGPIYEYMYEDAGAGCGHRANVLMPQLTHIGIGEVTDKVYGTLSVQDFIASALWNPYNG